MTVNLYPENVGFIAETLVRETPEEVKKQRFLRGWFAKAISGAGLIILLGSAGYQINHISKMPDKSSPNYAQLNEKYQKANYIAQGVAWGGLATGCGLFFSGVISASNRRVYLEKE